MTIITFTKEEVAGLLGRKISEKEVTDALPLLGMPIEEVKDGAIFVEVTPNRPDLLSVEGIARALSSFLEIKTGLREYNAKPSGIKLFVDGSVKKIRPSIAAALASGVEVNDEFVKSMIQLQEKLHETFGRKRRKLAIGIHDFAPLSPPFYYKAVAPPELGFIPLDMKKKLTLAEILQQHPKGIEYGGILKGASRYPVIVDSKNDVLSMPPIINGELTRVTGKTSQLFLELTGTDAYTVMDALRILATALADRGAELSSVKVVGEKSFTSPDLSFREISVDPADVNGLLGTSFSQNEMKRLLERMGHEVETGSLLKVKMPCYRTDVVHWVDIAEDVAIAYGYNEFETTLPDFFTIGAEKPLEVLCSQAREVMFGLGFEEVLAWYLSSEKLNFDMMLAPEVPHVRIKNPLTENFTMMRTWALPSLLSILSENKHVQMPIKIFEVGDVALLEGGKAREARKLCFAVQNSQAAFSEIKSVAESVLFELDWRYEMRETEHPSFIKGRVVEVLRNGKRSGMLGEIHPQVLNNFGLEHPVIACELEIQ